MHVKSPTLSFAACSACSLFMHPCPAHPYSLPPTLSCTLYASLAVTSPVENSKFQKKFTTCSVGEYMTLDEVREAVDKLTGAAINGSVVTLTPMVSERT